MRISLLAALLAFIGISAMGFSDEQVIKVLDQYKKFLEEGTYVSQDFSKEPVIPKSRYYTFRMAFEAFAEKNGKVIVELGTTRSFVHGGAPGCNSDDPSYWTPEKPENWDWGAGGFTRMAASALAHMHPQIHTVDLAKNHIERCKIITAPFKNMISYHVCSSVHFLRKAKFKQGIDLLYLDTGDMTPIEPTAQLQLQEAKVIVERNLIADGGLILIDDVRSLVPRQYGETGELGKAKYSIPYLQSHGFEIIANEYQVLLRKKSK